MKTIIPVILVFALTGCGSLQRSSLVSPRLDSIGGSVDRASGELDRAELMTERVIKYGAMVDDPEVKKIADYLKKAKAELAGAKLEIGTKQKDIDRMTEASNKAIDRLNYLEPKYATSVGLLWRWRIIAILSWVGAAAYLVAKFYFRSSFL